MNDLRTTIKRFYKCLVVKKDLNTNSNYNLSGKKTNILENRRKKGGQPCEVVVKIKKTLLL